MLQALQRFFDLREGERTRVVLLSLYLFLVISTYVAGKSTRDALFLARYSAVQLPYADLAVTLAATVLVSLFIRGRRLLNLRSLIAGSLLLFSGSALALWWFGRAIGASWVPAAVYVWVGALGVVAPAQVWTLANYVLTLREAKRLFGVIGSGAILGWMAGGLLTSATATRAGAEETLLAIGIALGLCAGLVVGIWSRRPAELEQAERASLDGNHLPPQGLSDACRLVCSSPYLRAIALVIVVSSLVTGIAAWQFKAIAKTAIPDTNLLAAFFGRFNFWAGALALVTQLALTSRLLHRFGVGLALFIVPVALLGGSVALLAWGTLAAVVLLKGADQVLRYSIDKSTVELLYLPVPPAQTFSAKLFIDSVGWRAGDGLASVVILAATLGAALTPRSMAWVTMSLLLAWIAAAVLAYRQYVANLSASVHQHRIDVERASAPVLDRSMRGLVGSKLASDVPEDVLYGLGLLDVGEQRVTHPAIRPLLHHHSPAVRARAVAILRDTRDTTVIPRVEALLRDPDIRVRTEALLYLAQHTSVDPLVRLEELGDFQDFSIRSAMVAFLSRPGPTQNLDAATMLLDAMVGEAGPSGARTRIEAARLIGMLPRGFDRQARRLLEDPDPEVVRQALRSVGRACRRTHVGFAIGLLADPGLGEEAGTALAACGDRVVGTLRDHLIDPDVPAGIRRLIPDVLRRIGTPAAGRALAENLIAADPGVRARIISALNKLAGAHPDCDIDAGVVETALVAEIMGHYRSYEILGILGAPASREDPLTGGLRESMQQELERIFRLLKLRYPAHDIHSAYVGVQSRNPLVHDHALEFMHNVLAPRMRELLVPLIDSEVPVEERIRRAPRMLGTDAGSREETIAALVESDDPRLNACAAYSIGALRLRSMAHELDRWVDDPDPLLRGTARHSRLQLAS